MLLNQSYFEDSKSEVQFFTPKDKPYGLTFGQWTVNWWRWVFSCPVDANPILDDDGINSAVNQSGPVWFIGGTFGENRSPTRMCTVAAGKSILFPVINYEMNALEDPRLRTPLQLTKHVYDDIDDIVIRDALVNGKHVEAFRVRSDPEIFELAFGKNNCLAMKPGITRAASDGYWVFIKFLHPGSHRIHFHGSCSAGIRTSTATYHLNII